MPEDAWKNSGIGGKKSRILLPYGLKLLYSLFDALDNMDKNGALEVQFYWPDIGSA